MQIKVFCENISVNKKDFSIIREGVWLMFLPRLRKKLRNFLPVFFWKVLRKAWFGFHFVGSERMATFTLRFKARMPTLTLQKKIIRKMAFDRDHRLTIYADKVMVREFVKDLIGLQYLTTSYGEYLTLENLERSSFPKNFVLKSNHGSGASVICWEGAPRGTILPEIHMANIWEKYLVHPDDLEWERLVELSNAWMKVNYYWEVGRFPEWAYKDIPPRMLLEEVLTHDGRIPEDYKFFMVNGDCLFIQLDTSRFTQHKRDLYSQNWELLDARMLYPPSGLLIERPVHLDEMISIAKSLSAGIDFVRVDLYITDKGIKFGELTNYPDGGFADIKPRKLSIDLAKKWNQNYSLVLGNS